MTRVGFQLLLHLDCTIIASCRRYRSEDAAETAASHLTHALLPFVEGEPEDVVWVEVVDAVDLRERRAAGHHGAGVIWPGPLPFPGSGAFFLDESVSRLLHRSITRRNGAEGPESRRWRQCWPKRSAEICPFDRRFRWPWSTRTRSPHR